MKRIYIICPVRSATDKQKERIMAYANNARGMGHYVHNPLTDVDQSDPIGNKICEAHKRAMERCDEVHLFWDIKSSGCHFDLGMAYALGKKIYLVHNFQEDAEGKSYLKLIRYLEEAQRREK